ncbi:MAG: methyltransferase domain-containing protein [Actinomycetota bacterium]
MSSTGRDLAGTVGPEPATGAGRRWAEALGEWAIPDEILAQAPTSPWEHNPATFAVDDTLDREVLSAQVARSVLPTEGGSVLDVGCGGGRAAMSLVPPAERVIGVDESPAMLAEFTSAAADAGVRSMTTQGRWPDVAADAPVADVVTCHHVAYNVADIEPFLLELTAHARLAVVLVLPVRHPMACWSPAWRHFWGLERPTSPTSDDLAAVLGELGLDAERWEMARPALSRNAEEPSTRVPVAGRILCLPTSRADEIRAYLDANEPPWVTTHTVFRWPGDPR